MTEKFFDYLKGRGYVYQATNEEQIQKIVNAEKPMTFYLGLIRRQTVFISGIFLL